MQKVTYIMMSAILFVALISTGYSQYQFPAMNENLEEALQKHKAPAPLCREDCGELNSNAMEHYNLALNYIDRVYYKGAIDELEKAAELDPDHVNLHFFLARLARYKGEMAHQLNEARRYYTIAENALNHISNIDNLNATEANHLESAMEIIKKEMATLETTYNRRNKIGVTIISEYLEEVGKFETPEEEEEEGGLPGPTASAPGDTFGDSSSVFGNIIDTFSGSSSTAASESPFATGGAETSEAAPASPFSDTGEAATASPFSDTGETATASPFSGGGETETTPAPETTESATSPFAGANEQEPPPSPFSGTPGMESPGEETSPAEEIETEAPENPFAM